MSVCVGVYVDAKGLMCFDIGITPEKTKVILWSGETSHRASGFVYKNVTECQRTQFLKAKTKREVN